MLFFPWIVIDILERYVDLDSGQIDTEAQLLLTNLRDRVQRSLCADNTYQDEIKWDEDLGVNREDFDHLR